MKTLSVISQRIINPQIISPINGFDAGQYSTRLYQILFYVFFSFCAIAFLLMVMIGGYQWITSSGDKQAIENARTRVMNGFTGLVIILILFFVVRAVNSIFGIDFAGWDVFP
ncbi:MAG TPA: hypothetical protein VI819_00005 [Patescibacteria group bacterium]|nr:hypothetical protein [Patescibacteria group bacterium]